MKKVLVGIIIGSDSDLSVMSEAAAILEEFNIPYEITIASAHRTPERTLTYAKSAYKRGLKVIIAGAGGAAHLPGIIAALTPIPVIGVPMHTKALSGLDSLYSIVQMPPGIPVATVGIGGAKNAALLAIKILAIHDANIMNKILKYRKDLENAVITKAEKLKKIGYKEYLERNK
jgi:5-(carboxyamino)imidazole ribonucleotide mutase